MTGIFLLMILLALVFGAGVAVGDVKTRRDLSTLLSNDETREAWATFRKAKAAEAALKVLRRGREHGDGTP